MRFTYFILTLFLLFSIGCQSKSDASSAKPSKQWQDIPAAWKLGPAAPIEKVKFRTSDGVDIVGSFRPSAGTPPGKIPGLICVPMLGHTRDTYDEFTSHLSEIGIATLAIDLRGHGESTMGGKLDFRKFNDKQWNDCVKDLNASFGWMLSQPQIESRHIGFIGASIGANLALMVGFRNEVNMVIALSPGLDFHGVKPESGAAKIHGKPVYVLATDGDKYSADSTSKLSQIMDPKNESKIIKGRKEHGTDMFKIPFFQEELAKWIKDKFDAMVRDQLTTDNPTPEGHARPIYPGAAKDKSASEGDQTGK